MENLKMAAALLAGLLMTLPLSVVVAETENAAGTETENEDLEVYEKNTPEESKDAGEDEKGQLEAEENEEHELEIKEISKREIEIEDEERELEIKEINEREIEIEGRNPDEEREEKDEDKYRLKISTKDGIDFEMEYEDFVAGDNLEIELEFEVEFDEIVEFIDNDGDGVYDEGEEVWTYDLEKAEFLPIERQSENVENAVLHRITIQTADGVLKVVIHASGVPVLISGENVTPNEVKIDVEISGFPYRAENSKLALKVELESELEVEEEKRSADGEEEVVVVSGRYGGFFSWKDTAVVDGTPKPVLSTEITEDREEGDRELYLVYERGAAIVHDPKVGVLGAIKPVPVLPWLTVIVAAALAALLSMGITRLTVLRRG